MYKGSFITEQWKKQNNRTAILHYKIAIVIGI